MNRNDWWRGGVIYQVYPRSFFDSNGDGVGDLLGVVEKSDYIASLNVDAIWLSPFFTSPMKDFGYDVSDYRGVDPLFGTLEDFKQVIDLAHAGSCPRTDVHGDAAEHARQCLPLSGRRAGSG